MNGAIYCFTNSRISTVPVRVYRITCGEKIKVRELEPLLHYDYDLRAKYDFALCVLKNRYVVLSGGNDLHMTLYSKKCYLFDTVRGVFLASTRPPDLGQGRSRHASCATEKAIFVYGG